MTDQCCGNCRLWRGKHYVLTDHRRCNARLPTWVLAMLHGQLDAGLIEYHTASAGTACRCWEPKEGKSK